MLFAAMTLVLMLRPQGLFGTRGARVKLAAPAALRRWLPETGRPPLVLVARAVRAAAASAPAPIC